MIKNYSLFKLSSALVMTVALAFTSVDTKAQSIPNGDFENWTTNKWMDPQFFQSSNDDNARKGSGLSNVLRVTDSYHATYAVQLSCIKFGPDTLGAYIADGNPGGSGAPSGGIPISQSPTGISFHYKYTCTSADTGLCIVWFKVHDSLLAVYAFKLDSTSSYKLFNGTFSPALTKTPDTVVFALATSILIVNNGNGIPGSVLTVDSVNFTGLTSQPAMLNGDFENWVPDSNVTPNMWETNQLDAQTTDAASGNFAMQLVTMGPNPNNNQTQSGYADDGKNIQIAPHRDSLVGGWPYTQTVDSLVFDYKYINTAVTDSADINIGFKKSSSYVAGMNWRLGRSTTYKHMSLPFTIGTTPDSALVQMSSSNLYVFDTAQGNYVTPDSCIGATFKIDHLHFGSYPLGIKQITEPTGVSVYPNPNNGRFTVELNGKSNGIAMVEVYNVLGEKVYGLDRSQLSFFNPQFNLDLTAQPAGIYFVKTYSGNSVTVTKVIKQ